MVSLLKCLWILHCDSFLLFYSWFVYFTTMQVSLEETSCVSVLTKANLWLTQLCGAGVCTYVLLFVQMKEAPLGQVCLRAFGNCSRGWTRIAAGSLFFFSFADVFWFSNDVRQRGPESEGRLSNTPTGSAQPTDSNDTNQPNQSRASIKSYLWISKDTVSLG